MPAREPARYSDDRLGRLEAATERLSQNVVGLSTSLAIVTEISQRQADVEVKAAHAVESALAAAQEAQAASKKVLTVQDARRRTITGAAIAGIVLLVLIGVVQHQFTQQIHERLVASYNGCLKSNARVDVEVAVLVSIANEEIGENDAGKRRAIMKGADALKTLKTDCAMFDPEKHTPKLFGLFS